jgi:molecular chaperone DnaK
MKLGEAMYKEQQAAAGAAEPDQGDGQPKDENVVDADFEEVKEDSKQA